MLTAVTRQIPSVRLWSWLALPCLTMSLGISSSRAEYVPNLGAPSAGLAAHAAAAWNHPERRLPEIEFQSQDLESLQSVPRLASGRSWGATTSDSLAQPARHEAELLVTDLALAGPHQPHEPWRGWSANTPWDAADAPWFVGHDTSRLVMPAAPHNTLADASWLPIPLALLLVGLTYAGHRWYHQRLVAHTEPATAGPR